jgi:hypothetical protein
MSTPVAGHRASALRRTVIGVATASSVLVGLGLIAAAVTLGRCDAFGGRCPADEPGLLEDDVFGMSAFGAVLIVAVPFFLYRPTARRLLAAVPVAVAAALVVGLIARFAVA